MSVDVELDVKLKPVSLDPEHLSKVKLERWIQKDGSAIIVRDSIPAGISHINYLGYLDVAWAYHLGVVLSPDIVWYTIVSELTSFVRENPERYRRVFTTSPSAVTIRVSTSREVSLPLDQLIEQLRCLVPNDLTGAFLPKFSTQGEAARSALYGAFADLVSPYYSYVGYICGIPWVKIEGVRDDWMLMGACLDELGEIFPREYCDLAGRVINRIAAQFRDPDPEFLKNIFQIENCGQICSPQTPSGWFLDFLRVRPVVVPMAPTHISRVKWVGEQSRLQYELLQGVFSSELKDGGLIPSFGSVVVNRTGAAPSRGVEF